MSRSRSASSFLLDEGTFEETDKLVTHHCTDFGMERAEDLRRRPSSLATDASRGRLVFVFAQDFTVFGGSLSEANAGKICKIMDMAMKVGRRACDRAERLRRPLASRKGVMSLAGYADIFLRNTLASGRNPADLGHHGAVRRPARCIRRPITDFIAMVDKTSYMFRHRSRRDQDGVTHEGG